MLALDFGSRNLSSMSLLPLLKLLILLCVSCIWQPVSLADGESVGKRQMLLLPISSFSHPIHLWTKRCEVKRTAMVKRQKLLTIDSLLEHRF